jgi:cytochrome P450
MPSKPFTKSVVTLTKLTTTTIFGVTEAGKPPYGLFQLTDRVDHARRRKLLGKGFTVASLRQDWEAMVSEKVTATIHGMRCDAKTSNGEVDVRKWWVLMASDVISKMMFGESFDALKTGKVHNCLEIRSIWESRLR